MKQIPFYKYQGAGNDFILIDQRDTRYLESDQEAIIQKLCDRRFGIGADGLMLLEKADGYDFRMVYFNADGREGSMCGNGGRCIVAFAHHLGLVDQTCTFIAIDGPHKAIVKTPNYIELKMQDVEHIEVGEDHFILDTGSPHYIQFVSDIDQVDVVDAGKEIRYNNRFAKEGINVNFVDVHSQQSLRIATYERGVEDETLACGTGVTAAAIAHHLKTKANRQSTIDLKAKGGDLQVRLDEQDGYYTNIWLCGPADYVFKGSINEVVMKFPVK